MVSDEVYPSRLKRQGQIRRWDPPIRVAESVSQAQAVVRDGMVYTIRYLFQRESSTGHSD